MSTFLLELRDDRPSLLGKNLCSSIFRVTSETDEIATRDLYPALVFAVGVGVGCGCPLISCLRFGFPAQANQGLPSVLAPMTSPDAVLASGISAYCSRHSLGFVIARRLPKTP